MTQATRQPIYTREDMNSLISMGEEWNFHEEGDAVHIHSLHPFPAKFVPQIPRRAISLWTRDGDTVYDPFVGSGTTLLEASLQGRHGIGTDNNAVATLVSKAKCRLYTQKDLGALLDFQSRMPAELEHAPERPDLVPTNKNFLTWFEPTVLNRLATLKGLILSEPEPIRELLMSVFSSIVVRVSFQDSDTRYARKIRTVRPGEVDSCFLSKLSEVTKGLPEVMVPGRRQSTIVQSDARRVPFIRSGSISLIVTSPPYLNVFDYHKYHRQRLHWTSGDILFARNLEIGSHDEFTRPNASPEKYFSDMDACFGEWARVLKPGGRCLIVVGDAIVLKQPVCVADRFIDLLKRKGLVEEKRWIRTLHATKRAFSTNNRRITHEHVLLLRKA